MTVSWEVRCSDLAGTLTLLLREGDATPVLPIGASGPSTTAFFGQFTDNVTCNDGGSILFSANFTGGVPGVNNSGLLKRDFATGTISVVIQENDPLPGPPGPLINGWAAYGINDSDEVIARVSMRTNVGGVTPATNTAIITDGGTPGTFRLMAREGDVSPEGGNTFAVFRNVFIGNIGATCIETGLSGTTESIYSAASAGAFVNVAKEGTPAVGLTSFPNPTSASTYRFLNRPAMNHDGDVLFTSTLTLNATAPAVDTTNNAGLWRTDGPGVPPTDPTGLISRKGDIEDDLCATIVAYDLNTPNQPTGGVSGSGRAINDTDNLVVNLFHSVPTIGTVEGVYILDNLPPVFCDPPPNELRNIMPGGSVVVSWVEPTVVDDNDPSPVVVQSHSPGDTFFPGVTVVTYTATDFTGNVSVYRFRVIVTELRDLAKVITSPGLLAQNNDADAGGELFRAFTRICLNDSEEVTIEGSTVSNKRGVWSNGGAGAGAPLASLALTGDLAFPPLDFDSFSDIRISDRGVSSFGSQLTPGTTTSDDALFLGDASLLGLGAYESDPAPGTSGVFRQLFPQAQSQSSTADGIYFPAHIDIPGTLDTGIWHYDLAGATTVLSVGEGNPITGIPALAGLSYGHLASRVVTGGNTQHFAFSSLLSVPGVNGTNNTAIFRRALSGTPTLVAREGDTAKGPNEFSTNFKKSFEIDDKLARRDPGRFQTFLSESLSPDGSQLAFSARLANDGAVTNVHNSGVWKVNAANELDLVAREGHQAPGFAEGVCFDRFDNILIDNDGWVWFRAYLKHDSILGIDSSNDCGIWTNDDGFMRWMAHEGQLAPNTDGGLVLRITSFSHLDGGLAATLVLSPGTGDTLFANNVCLVSGFDGITGLMEINLREGDLLDLGNTALDKFTIFTMDEPFNAVGGSGGFCTPVQGSIDRVAVKTRFTSNSNGVLIRALSDTGP